MRNPAQFFCAAMLLALPLCCPTVRGEPVQVEGELRQWLVRNTWEPFMARLVEADPVKPEVVLETRTGERARFDAWDLCNDDQAYLSYFFNPYTKHDVALLRTETLEVFPITSDSLSEGVVLSWAREPNRIEISPGVGRVVYFRNDEVAFETTVNDADWVQAVVDLSLDELVGDRRLKFNRSGYLRMPVRIVDYPLINTLRANGETAAMREWLLAFGGHQLAGKPTFQSTESFLAAFRIGRWEVHKSEMRNMLPDKWAQEYVKHEQFFWPWTAVDETGLREWITAFLQVKVFEDAIVMPGADWVHRDLRGGLPDYALTPMADPENAVQRLTQHLLLGHGLIVDLHGHDKRTTPALIGTNYRNLYVTTQGRPAAGEFDKMPVGELQQKFRVLVPRRAESGKTDLLPSPLTVE